MRRKPTSDEYQVQTFSELCDEADHDSNLRQTGRQWGRWRLRIETLELAFEQEPGRYRYFVDIEQMNTCAAMLDWIFQEAGKSWCTKSDKASLIDALHDIFDPQASLCSFACGSGDGAGATINASEFLRRRYLDRASLGARTPRDPLPEALT